MSAGPMVPQRPTPSLRSDPLRCIRDTQPAFPGPTLARRKCYVEKEQRTLKGISTTNSNECV